jgi:predicted small integral membrane protein
MNKKEVVRVSKLLLVFTVAVYFTLVVVGNIFDYGVNYAWVKNVLNMGSTFEGNNFMWRAIENPMIHNIFYWIIIIWESLAGLCCWIGSFSMYKNLKKNSNNFEKSKTYGILGLMLGLLLWFFAFITIGGEWFLMWQSEMWNGQDAAFMMFTIMGIIFLSLLIKDE